MLESSNVLIADEAGSIIDIVNEAEAGDGIRQLKGLLTPGFVNCHCHLELSHMKGVIAEQTGLVPFLMQVVQLRSFPREVIDAAMANAEQELYNSGTVAVGDISNTIDTLALKRESKMHWYNFIEILGLAEDMAAERFAAYKKVYDAFSELHNQVYYRYATLVPHAPYTISRNMFSLINNAAADAVISVHNQECMAEDELYRNGTGDFFKLYDSIGMNASSFKCSGKSSLQTYLPLLDKAKQLLLIHNTFTASDDIVFTQKQTAVTGQAVFWCLCANANLYIENSMPPVQLLRDHNCSITIGTDSYSSNRSMNMLDEMRTIQQRTGRGIPTAEILQWATINGARALCMDDRLGSFDKGKQPGIVLIENMDNLLFDNNSTAHRIA